MQDDFDKQTITSETRARGLVAVGNQKSGLDFDDTR